MNCRDMDKLLSAYANNELDTEQTGLVERHLASCARCRESLEQFVESGRQLMSLQQTPPLPDVKPSIMSRIIMRDVKVHPRKRVRIALVALPITLIAIALLALQLLGFFTSPSGIVAEAYAATQKITTYHSLQTTEMSYQDSGVSSVSYQEKDYDGPERYHLKLFSNGQSPWRIEVTGVNGQIYYYQDMGSLAVNPASQALITDSINQLIKTAPQLFDASAILQMANTDDMLNYLTNVKKLGNENLDGLTCLHYQATLDWGKIKGQLEETLNQSPSSLSQKERDYYQSAIDSLLNAEIEGQCEIWISKDDGLIRQIKLTQKMSFTQNLPSGTRTVESSSVVTINYSYNKPVIIQAPLTGTGELLPGWQLYSNIPAQ
jgi:hypothetical protein